MTVNGTVQDDQLVNSPIAAASFFTMTVSGAGAGCSCLTSFLYVFQNNSVSETSLMFGWPINASSTAIAWSGVRGFGNIPACVVIRTNECAIFPARPKAFPCLQAAHGEFPWKRRRREG